MNQSASIDQLLPALCAARAAFGPIPKNQTAFVKSDKGSYSFQYADLGAILDVVTPPLTANGLLLVFGLHDMPDGTLEVSSRVYHCASAQYLENTLSAPKPTNATAIGSLITYLRRYTSCPLLGVCAEEDDDASAVEGNCITTQASKRETTTASVLTNGNGHPPAPPKAEGVERPTEKHIEALCTLAAQCHEDLEVFEQRLRTIMGLKPSASVARRLLPRTMTMAHYMDAVAYYQRLLAQLERVHEGASHDLGQTPDHAGRSEDVSLPTPTTDHASLDGDAAARDALRTEALDWGIKAAEIEYILTHHADLVKARALLWRARRPGAETLVTAGS